MILSIYIFFIAFQMAAILISSYLAYRISRALLTPTFTWILVSLAFFLRFLTYVHSLFFAKDIIQFFGQYPPWMVFVSHVIEALITGLFLTFISRTYFALRSKNLMPK